MAFDQHPRLLRLLSWLCYGFGVALIGTMVVIYIGLGDELGPNEQLLLPFLLGLAGFYLFYSVGPLVRDLADEARITRSPVACKVRQQVVGWKTSGLRRRVGRLTALLHGA